MNETLAPSTDTRAEISPALHKVSPDTLHKVSPDALRFMFDANGRAIDYSTWTDAQMRALTVTTKDPARIAWARQRVRENRERSARVIAAQLSHNERRAFWRLFEARYAAGRDRQHAGASGSKRARAWNRRAPRRAGARKPASSSDGEGEPPGARRRAVIGGAS